MTPQTLAEKVAALEERVTAQQAMLFQMTKQMGDFKTFFDQHEAKEDEREHREMQDREDKKTLDEKRAKIHYWWLSILSALIIASIIGLTSWMMNFMSTHHISSNVSLSVPASSQNAKN